MTASGFTRSRDERVEWWRANFPQARVYDDVERRGVLWNHKRIIDHFVDSGDEYMLVVQDDAIPLRGWQDHLEQVIEVATMYPVSLCHFQKRGKELWERGYSFGYSASSLWGQAVLYNREFATAYAQTVQDVWTIDPIGFQKSDDGVVVVHNLVTGNNSSFTTRALFDHAEGHSTLGHISKGRRPVATIENTPGPWTSEARRHAVPITNYTHRTAEMVKAYREQVKSR